MQKKEKTLEKNLSTLEVDKGAPLKGKMLIQMFEKASSRTRIKLLFSNQTAWRRNFNSKI